MADNPPNPTPKKRGRPDWAPRVLAALATTANIRASCRAAGVDRSVFYDRRNSDPAFAEAVTRAIDDATDDLELEARRRASEGVRRLKFHQGDLIMVPALGPDGLPLKNDKDEPVLVPYVEHEYSDTLMIFLLKAHRPEKYRERHEVKHAGTLGLEHSGEVRGTSDEQRCADALAILSRFGLAPGAGLGGGGQGAGGEGTPHGPLLGGAGQADDGRGADA